MKWIERDAPLKMRERFFFFFFRKMNKPMMKVTMMMAMARMIRGGGGNHDDHLADNDDWSLLGMCDGHRNNDRCL